MTWLQALTLALALSLAATVRAQEPAQRPPGHAGLPAAPRIEVQAPQALMPQASRLARLDPARLSAVMRLVGLDDPGPPIRVFLVPEDAALARQTSRKVAAFAAGGEIVLFADRTPSYPHESLQEVFQHEVAHVLIDRAAGGRPVPRWFHEGVALAAERTWSLRDRTSFALDVAFGGRVPAAALDRLFDEESGDVDRAYRLSGLLVQDLLETYGPGVAARILARMRGGMTFDAAFRAATGVSVGEAVDAFWHRRRLWTTWLPWLTSSAALWALMTALAVAAFAAVRWRRSRRRWDEEEEKDA